MSCDVGEVTERLENELCSFNFMICEPDEQWSLDHGNQIPTQHLSW